MPRDSDERIDGLERLAMLLEDGRISEDEFQQLKANLLDSPASPSLSDESRVDDGPGTQPLPEQSATANEAADHPGGESRIYKFAFGLGIASVLFGGTFGLLAWATVAVSGYALYSVKTADKRWMAWTGLVLGIVFSLVNAYWNGHLNALIDDPDSQAPALSTPGEQHSLSDGLDVESFISNWNTFANQSGLGADWEISPASPYSDDDTRVTLVMPIAKSLDDTGILITAIAPDGASEDIENVGFQMLGMRVGHSGHEAEVAAMLTTWSILCAVAEGDYESTDCAPTVASDLGFPFEVIQDWNSYYEPMPQGTITESVEVIHAGHQWSLNWSYSGAGVSVRPSQ